MDIRRIRARSAFQHRNLSSEKAKCTHALPNLGVHGRIKPPDCHFVKYMYYEILQRAARVYNPKILPTLKPLLQGGSVIFHQKLHFIVF